MYKTKQDKRLKSKKIIISLISVLTMVMSLASFQAVSADDEHNHKQEENISILSNYSTEVKPQINVNYLGFTPSNPMVGQDITVTYEIDPLPFYNNTSGNKEIVLVLDISGSMKDNNKLVNLKSAANKFIEKLSATTANGVTPQVTNLKIGIVTFNDEGRINSELIEVTTESKVNSSNVRTLKSIISGLNASDGTNTGDGLRKGAYILNKSNASANKSIVFMADGQPTYYTYTNKDTQTWTCYCSRSSCNNSTKCTVNKPCRVNHSWVYSRYCGNTTSSTKVYYTELNDKTPNTVWDGDNQDRYGECLNYALEVGGVIEPLKYNIYSIGYGLGSTTSSQNVKMKKIHESMGGVSTGSKSTFFTSDEGAIDSVFDKIADSLITSYNIEELGLSINLADGITAVSGFEISDGNGGKINIEPIVYTRNTNNQYTAPKQTIQFVIRASVDGELPILSSTSFLTYKDINGVTQNVSVENATISVRPVSYEEKDKLDVDFDCVPKGYLIGDTASGIVTFTKNTMAEQGIRYTNGKFTLTEKPGNLEFENGINSVLNFGTITNTASKEYRMKINDDPNITTAEDVEYSLSGQHSYNLIINNNTKVENGENTATLKVKRGQVKVKVFDSENNDITLESKATINLANTNNKIQGEFIEDTLLFDTVSSGDYIVALESVPDGCDIPQIDGSTIIRVDYTNNVVEVTFKVNGVATGDTDIVAHGVYMNSNTKKLEEMLLESKDDKSIRLGQSIPVNIGVLLEVSGKNNEINLSANNGKINNNKISLYEVTDNGVINKINASVSTLNSVKLGEVPSGKCLIIYEYIPNKENSEVSLYAQVKNTNKSKRLKLKFGESALPNLF